MLEARLAKEEMEAAVDQPIQQPMAVRPLLAEVRLEARAPMVKQPLRVAVLPVVGVAGVRLAAIFRHRQRLAALRQAAAHQVVMVVMEAVAVRVTAQRVTAVVVATAAQAALPPAGTAAGVARATMLRVAPADRAEAMAPQWVARAAQALAAAWLPEVAAALAEILETPPAAGAAGAATVVMLLPVWAPVGRAAGVERQVQAPVETLAPAMAEACLAAPPGQPRVGTERVVQRVHPPEARASAAWPAPLQVVQVLAEVLEAPMAATVLAA